VPPGQGQAYQVSHVFSYIVDKYNFIRNRSKPGDFAENARIVCIATVGKVKFRAFRRAGSWLLCSGQSLLKEQINSDYWWQISSLPI
jgi:hypothetical protein